MKLSIVIPYYNRRELLINVLKSINMTGDIEVIIVDDGSDEENRLNFHLMDYKLLILERSKVWRGACVAYNAGFKEATGDVIMINSSECIHVGDVTGYIFENFKENDYFSFSTYMMNQNEDLNKPKFKNFWGVHSSVGNFIPYCGVISKKNMDLLGGYDERFAKGIGFDDYDFTHRVKNLKLNMKCIDDPYVIHQWHSPTKYPNTLNYDLLMYLNKNFPDRIKANG
jgi:glycosyltransferase involved in cell wall biosynthesis